MPVGMTLQQLYSQPAYSHSDATSGVGAAAPSSMAMSSAPMPKQRAASPNTSDKEYPPRNLHDHTNSAAYPPEPRSSYPDHHASMQQQQHFPPAYGQQMPPPHAYAQYHPKPHPGSDEYSGIADPLPFEYMGMRKFPDAMKEHADHRYAPPPMYQGSYGGHSSVYDSQHAHPPKGVEERAYHQPYPPHHDRAYHSEPHYAMYHGSTHGSNPISVPSHSFPPLVVDTQPSLKKDNNSSNNSATQPPQQQPQQSYSPHGPVEFASSPNGQQGAGQEAVIKVKTPLKTKYWRNGRRNLQCFPSCKVFGDYSSIKIEDLKQHDFMWGKCRGSLITEVTLNSSVSFDDILLLSRVHSMENVPVAFEEAVIRECMLGRMVEPEVMDAMKDQWITGERLPDFVQQEGNTACYEFKPKVWKYTEDMTQGKCKRRNVKYYVQFEAFVLVMSGERRYYACIGSGMSTAFEVGSSRVLARQKRKAASGLDANPLYLKNGQPVGSPTQVSMNNGSSAASMPHAMMQQQSMMHSMHQQMYPPSYAPQHGYGAPSRHGMPQGLHPSMMPPMHHGGDGQLHHPGYHQHQQAPTPVPVVPMAPTQAPTQAGQKRKASPSGAAPRASKAKKASKEAAPAL